MPSLLNPFRYGGGPATVPSPWAEITRQDTVAAGKLTISGLDLSLIKICKLIVSSIVVTTDDSQVYLRYAVGGAVITASSYRWGVARLASGLKDQAGSSGTSTFIPLSASTATRKLGNVSGETLEAEVIIFNPASGDYHETWYQTAYDQALGSPMGFIDSCAHLENTGALTGFEVYADSDIVSGKLTLTGIQ